MVLFQGVEPIRMRQGRPILAGMQLGQPQQGEAPGYGDRLPRLQRVVRRAREGGQPWQELQHRLGEPGGPYPVQSAQQI